MNRPSGSLRSQPRSTSLTSLARSGSSLDFTLTSTPTTSPTSRAMTLLAAAVRRATATRARRPQGGALASQLGSVTVSAVPQAQSAEVGGVQNAVTNLGASMGTALAGSIMIAALTTSFLTTIEANPAVPDSVTSQATVQLQSGAPFLSDAQLQTAFDEAGVNPELSQAALDANAEARLDGLRAALAILAFAALISLFFTQRIPSTQPRSPEPSP